MHKLLDHLYKQTKDTTGSVDWVEGHLHEQIAMTDMTENNNKERMTFGIHEARTQRNHIHLKSGRTGSEMDPSYNTGAVNGINNSNYSSAFGQYTNVGDDVAPLLDSDGEKSDDDDVAHCHSNTGFAVVADAANRKATIQLSIAAAICLVFMIGEALGKICYFVIDTVYKVSSLNLVPWN